jgi:thymidylate synthase (FAD)
MRSQRYVNESEPSYITPEEIKKEDLPLFIASMKSSWDTYNTLLLRGYKKEIARYVIPNACETQIITTMNFRELRHVIQLRTSNKAQPEMRKIANKIRDIMKEKAPHVFEDL